MVASRANYGRVKSVMAAVKAHPDLELQTIVAASALLYRFGKVVDIIEKDGFKVDSRVYIIIEGENPTTMAKSTGLAIIEFATIFENLQPDIVVTVADRFETMATAVAASYMNIPLAHVQGGELTGSIDESVRHAITKLAHIHFPSTEESKARLVRMGEAEDTVHMTGCPALDPIARLDLSIGDLFSRYGGVGASLDPSKPYIVVLQHPVTTEYGRGFDQINETLKAVEQVDMQTVWLWPNVDAGSDDISKGLRVYREKNKPEKIHFYRNFAVEDYNRLIKNCACLIGNSSSSIREGAFLGVPAVNIGTRQHGRERGPNVIDAPHDSAQIAAAINKQLAHGPYESCHIYGDGAAGVRIADILAKAEIDIQKRMPY